MKLGNYKVTLKTGEVKLLSINHFLRTFPTPGHNFQTRLTQIQNWFPTATDWEMIEDDRTLGSDNPAEIQARMDKIGGAR